MKNLLGAPLSFLNDFHGNKSSKRFWGNRLLTIGVFLSLGLFIINLAITAWQGKAMITTHENCMEIAKLFFYAGGGLLFGGVFEKIKLKK